MASIVWMCVVRAFGTLDIACEFSCVLHREEQDMISFTAFIAAAVLSIGLVPPAVDASPAPLISQVSSELLDAQQALASAGFYRGPFDGLDSPELRHAIVAFHKAAGFDRTSLWTPRDAVTIGTWVPSYPSRPDEPTRVEVDLDRQVLYVIVDGALMGVLDISSGSGDSGGSGHAHTPRGDFTLIRHIAGPHYSHLGFMYRPWYFVGGYAMHGSLNVPSVGASHGCVRLTMADADWVEDKLVLGEPIHLFNGGTNVMVRIPPPLRRVAHVTIV
jgi:hypothetical protein